MKTDKTKECQEEEEVQLLVDPFHQELLRRKYTFFVTNQLGLAIALKRIIVPEWDTNWMVANWCVFVECTLAFSFSFQQGNRQWNPANKDHNCLIHVTGLTAKRIFQAVSLPEAIIWEEERLGTCVWTLAHNLLGDFPDPV